MLKKITILAMAVLSFGAQAELIAHYTFDGTLADETSKWDIDSNYNNYSYDTPSGEGQSLFFDNQTRLPLKQQSGQLDALTISVWFKTGGAPNGQPGGFDNWSFIDFDRSEKFNLSVDNNGRAMFAYNNASSNGIIDRYSNINTLNDNAWHHIYLTYGEQRGLQFIIDGQLDASYAYTGTIGNSVVRYGFIGDGSEASTYNGAGNDLFYSGYIDDLGYWDEEVLPHEYQLSRMATGTYNVASTYNVSAPAQAAGALLLCLVAGLRRKNRLS